MCKGVEGASNWEEARKQNSCTTKGQATHMGNWVAQEIWTSQLRCDSSNVYIAVWGEQLKKRISICVDIEASRLILRRDLVETRGNLVINQHEWLVLRTATRKSLSLRRVHIKLKLPASIINIVIVIIINNNNKVHRGRHLLWTHSWGWPDKEIWPDCGSKSGLLRTADNGNICSPMSLQWGESSTRAGETMRGNIVSWVDWKVKEDTAGLLWCICTTWGWSFFFFCQWLYSKH